MILNPPPIITGWGEARNGPVPVWALWFQNVYNILANDVSGSLVVASVGGTLTSYTATYRLKQIGYLVSLVFDITLTNAGTGSGALRVTLPVQAASSISGCATETVTGFACTSVSTTATYFDISKYDGTTIIATGRRIIGSVTYFSKST